MALLAVLAGASVSLAFMFNAGRNQNSIFLIVLFTGWVLSPFIALLVTDVISRRWPIPARVPLYLLMLFITLGSLVSYSGAFSLPGMKPASKFLIVPLVSWLLMLTVILIVRSRPRKPFGKRKHTN